MIANSFYVVFAGDGYLFHGVTINVHLDLSFIIIPIMIVMGVLVVYIILEDRKYSFLAKGTKKNRFWSILLLTPIPVQAVLFFMGEPHGLTDRIGVIIALLQVALAWTAFKAYDVMEE